MSIGVTDLSETTNKREVGEANEFRTEKLILKLLPSRDGVVLRRLLMTAVCIFLLPIIKF